MGKVPPGQVVSKLVWPVLSATDIPAVDLKTYRLRVFGEVEKRIIVETGGKFVCIRL